MPYVILQFALIAALLLTSKPVAIPFGGWAMVGLAAGLVCWALLSMRLHHLRIGPRPGPNAPLVRHGPYAVMRHPMYAATLLGMAATLTAPPDGVRLLLWLCLAATLRAKARHEEGWLNERHADYAAYTETTNRFIPLPGPLVPLGRRLSAIAIRVAAVLLLLQLLCGLLPFTNDLHAWLACQEEPPQATPEYIVVLGGGGMPSGSTLLRSYYGAHFAARWPDATVVLCMPVDGALEDSDASRMRDELILRGISPERIRLERRGRNTAEQAAETRALLGAAAADRQLAIVTSGGHMRRSVLCFRKAGFSRVGSALAEDTSVEADLGQQLFARYGFWSRLQGLPGMVRELVAIAVYRLRGQI